MTDDPEIKRIRSVYAARAERRDDSIYYSLFDPVQLFIHQQRERACLRLLKRQGCHSLAGRMILEVGCGAGGVLLDALRWGACSSHLSGCDLLESRLATAQARLPPIALCQADGQHLPYETSRFDLVLAFTVFSSILEDRVRQNLAGEMLRVLKPQGMILWYDFWFNPANCQTRGLLPGRVRRLFPGCHCCFQRITLAPPLARRLVPLSWNLSLLLEKLTLFNSHYLAVIRPGEVG